MPLPSVTPSFSRTNYSVVSRKYHTLILYDVTLIDKETGKTTHMDYDYFKILETALERINECVEKIEELQDRLDGMTAIFDEAREHFNNNKAINDNKG